MTDDTGKNGHQMIGEQLKRLRGLDMTQADLAAAAGISLSLVQALEQNKRQTTVTTLHKLARALDVEIGELVSRKTNLPHPTEDSGVLALRRAVTSIDDLIGQTSHLPPATTEGLRRMVTYAWGAFGAGKYDQLGIILPSALLSTRTIELVGDTAELAANLYAVASHTLVLTGHPDAGHIAIREAMRLAKAGTDPLLPAALRSYLSWLLVTQGRYAESYDLAMTTAATVEPGSSEELPKMALWGSLLGRGATAAARAERGAEAHRLLGEARVIARHTGHRNDYMPMFGPDYVTMLTVDAHVVTQNYTSALTVARVMPMDSPLPLAERVRHLQDRAVAHTWLGHNERAVDILEEMARLAPPVWSAHQAQPKIIVRELRERERRSRTSARLKKLAAAFNVTD
jgi:transcriptional regulator with XRE-family HTH domain